MPDFFFFFFYIDIGLFWTIRGIKVRPVSPSVLAVIAIVSPRFATDRKRPFPRCTQQANIVVHQFRAPRFFIPAEKARLTVHLSYHGEHHYNSVRALTDEGNGPALPITLHTPTQGQAKGGSQGRGEKECPQKGHKPVGQTIAAYQYCFSCFIVVESLRSTC